MPADALTWTLPTRAVAVRVELDEPSGIVTVRAPNTIASRYSREAALQIHRELGRVLQAQPARGGDVR